MIQSGRYLRSTIEAPDDLAVIAVEAGQDQALDAMVLEGQRHHFLDVGHGAVVRRRDAAIDDDGLFLVPHDREGALADIHGDDVHDPYPFLPR